MRNIFVISDTHFDHEKVLTFRGLDGNLIRPNFTSVQEMNETIIQNWNEEVKPDDIVYHLGDVIFGRNYKQRLKQIIPRLMGRKRLILGNHDYEAIDFYPHFEKVMSWRQFGRDFKVPVVLTHFPLHETSFAYRAGGNGINIHGHIHEKVIEDKKFVNVAVERTNYRPVSIEAIVDGIK